MHTSRVDATPPPPPKPRPPSARAIALELLLTVPLRTRFKRVRRFLDWPAHAGPRGVAVAIMLHAALLMAMDAILRIGDRWRRERAAIHARLREELGRPPWPEEIAQAWREAHGLSQDHPVPW